MSSTLRLPKSKSRHIDGAQFQFGLDEAQIGAERFAVLFCNGRVARVREWLAGDVPVPPWVPALLAAMQLPEGRARAIATAEYLLSENSEPSASEAQLKARATKVRSQAASAVDQALKGADATDQEKADRRGALTDEPAIVGKARGKGQGRR